MVVPRAFLSEQEVWESLCQERKRQSSLRYFVNVVSVYIVQIYDAGNKADSTHMTAATGGREGEGLSYYKAILPGSYHSVATPGNMLPCRTVLIMYDTRI